MKIFEVSVADCASVAEVFNKAHKPFEKVWSEEEWTVFGGDTIKTREDCIFMLEGRKTYCAKDESNQLTGYISFRKKNEKVVWISELYVDPDFQGRGVGKMLIDFTIGFAKDNGCVLIALETHALADWAINFYKKLGFEIVNEKMNTVPYSFILEKATVVGRPVFALKI